MRNRILFFAIFGLFLASIGSAADLVPRPPELHSRLDRIVRVSDFGDIAYRAPRVGNFGPVVVLFHGIYGGASHLSNRELLDELDSRGARVFILDMPGTAESDKREFKGQKPGEIKRKYSAKYFQKFVERFVSEVVQEPCVLYGQSTLAMSVLAAARDLRSKVLGVALVSPTGVRVLSDPPTLKQRLFGLYLRSQKHALDHFYLDSLLSDENIRASVAPGVLDQSKVTETFLTEYRLGRNFLDQKWVSLSFVEGRLSYQFKDAGNGVAAPVTMIFGKEDVGISASDGAGNISNIEPDRAGDFQKIRPDFNYITLERSAGIVWKEKPAEIAEIILKM